MIYLASPYSSNREHNFRQAMNACRVYFLNQIPVFSPIVHWHPVANEYALGTTADHYEQQNSSGVAHCKEMHILQIAGYAESVGIAREVKWAYLYGRPVFLVTIKDNEIRATQQLKPGEMAAWIEHHGIKL